MTNKVLTISEIYTLFESEWVLLESPDLSESLEIKGGKVLWHSKDRDEVYRKLRESNPKHAAIIFTGKIPEDSAVILLL